MSAVHFPSPHVGLTWCGLPFDPPNNRALEGVDRDGLAFSTDMPAVTCPGCHADAAQPPKHDLTPSEVALAKVLAAWEGWEAVPPGASADVAAVLVSLTMSLVRNGFVASGALTDKGRALLDRARKAGVL